MRSLSSTLLTSQKSSIKKELIRLVLTDDVDTYTYYSTSGANRIKEIDHVEEGDRQAAQVILDNSGKVVSALALEGFKATVSRGITTTSDEYSAHAPLYVIGQQDHSWRGGLAVSLSLAGIPNLMASDEASEEYRQESDDTNTVKTLFQKIAGDTSTTMLTCYNHCKAIDCVFDSEDDLIDAFIPADLFYIPKKANRWNKLKELLNWTKCVMRVQNDGKIHVFVPVTTTSTTWQANTDYVVGDFVVPTVANEVEYKCTTAGKSHASTEPIWANALEVDDTISDGTVTWTVSYDYEYRLESTYHTFFSETYRKRVVIPGYVEVESSDSHDTVYTGSAEDPSFSGLTDEQKKWIVKREHHTLRVTSDAQCVKIATAILSHAQAAAERGSGSVPMNVGAEVHDFVKVKDTRLGTYRVGNIGRIRWYYVSGKQPTMEFRFGKLGFGLAGTAPVGPGGGAATDLGDIWNIINNILDTINYILNYLEDLKLNKIHSLDIYDQNGNYVGTLGGLTEQVFLGALATAANLKLYNSNATGGVSIAAGQLASTPDDGTLLLDAAVAVKVAADGTLVIPVK